MEAIKTLIFTLVLFAVGAIFSVYMVIHPNNSFDVSFFGGIFEMFAALTGINIYLIYNIIKRNK